MKQNKKFAMQTVDVLNLNLFSILTKEKVFKEMGLTIFKKHEMEINGRKICLAIIGESHFLWIQGRMMELLACTQLRPDLPEGMMLEKKVSGIHLNGFNYATTGNGLHYAVNGRFIKYDPVKNNLEGHGNDIIVIEESFPYTYDDHEYKCWTKLRLAQFNGQLILNTSHAYPPKYIVLTNSSIKL